jgi:hypothetical protein
MTLLSPQTCLLSAMVELHFRNEFLPDNWHVCRGVYSQLHKTGLERHDLYFDVIANVDNFIKLSG